MSNTLTSAIPQILKRALPVLRQNAVLPRLVQMNYGTEAQERGNTITIAKSVAVAARDVAPGVTPAANQDFTPTSDSLLLNKWKEATHALTDKEGAEIMEGFLPKQAAECIKAVINQVESDILAATLFTGHAVGTGGTTPFATNVNIAGLARTILNTNLAPMDERFVVLDPMAEGNAVVTPDVFRFDGAGNALTQINGALGTRLGMNWFMDQNIVRHTNAAAWITGFSVATAAATAGVTSITIINSTVTGTLVVGDLFTIAGGSQVYAITTVGTIATATATVLGNVTIGIYPAVATTVASGVAITVVASYMQNLVFHRDALAFASRRLAPALGAQGNSGQIVDDVSGLALTIEITRESYQSTFRASCLYGVKLVRPDFLVHLLG